MKTPSNPPTRPLPPTTKWCSARCFSAPAMPLRPGSWAQEDMCCSRRSIRDAYSRAQDSARRTQSSHWLQRHNSASRPEGGGGWGCSSCTIELTKIKDNTMFHCRRECHIWLFRSVTYACIIIWSHRSLVLFWYQIQCEYHHSGQPPILSAN